MKTKSRVKYYLILAIFAASLFVNTLTPFFASAQQASAMSPSDQAKSWLYFNALGACDWGTLTDNKNAVFDRWSRITVAHAQSGQWFANSLLGATNPTIGYFLDGKGVKTSGDHVGCGGDTTDWIVDASKLWGYSSPIDAMCSFGFQRENGSDCRDGSDWFVQGNANTANFEKAVKDKVYSGQAPSLPDEAHYTLVHDAFFSGCLGSGHQNPYTGSANDAFLYTITAVDTKGVSTSAKYYGTKNSSDSIWYSISPNHNNISDTCGNLANQINQYAPAYAKYLKDHQPGTNGVPGTCEERYAGSADEIAACQAGFNNKQQASYCDDTYRPNVTTMNACYYGRDTATAASGQTTPQQTDGTASSANKSTCTIQGIGWILCPVMNVMAKVVDGAYTFVSSLLTINPITTSGEDAGLYSAWGIIRNIANIAFVIAFLLIIFSQLTSVGISNYGIKKMLPRIVVAAILVNVSYWICAIAVDLSNIIGASLDGLFSSLSAQLKGPAASDFNTQADGWVGITEFIIAGGVVGAVTLYIGLAALIPALIAALLAIVTVFLVLTLRQALIILLIVLAPLAFVAYLLPNTESLFKKWRELFQTMLFMYPIIAFMFGASSFASQIIMKTATGDYKIVIQIMGALVSILPLMLTPMIMKASGALLGKFGGMINNPNRGPINSLRKRGDAYRDRRQNIMRARRLQGESAFSGARNRIRGDGSSRFRRAAAGVIGAGEGFTSGRAVSNLTREQQNTNAEQAAKQAAQDYIVNRVDSETKAGKDDYARELAGPTGDVSKVKAAAKAAKLREFNETVAAEKATMSHMGAAELSSIMNDTTASEERRSAAAGQIMKVGSDNDIHKVLDTLGTQQKDANGNFTDSAISAIQQQVAADIGSRKPVSLGASDVSNLNKGTYDGNFESKIASRLAAGKLSAEKLSQTSTDELDKIMGYVQANGAALKADPATAAALQALQNDIAEFRTNPQLQGRQPAHDVGSRMDNLHNLL